MSTVTDGGIAGLLLLSDVVALRLGVPFLRATLDGSTLPRPSPLAGGLVLAILLQNLLLTGVELARAAGLECDDWRPALLYGRLVVVPQLFLIPLLRAIWVWARQRPQNAESAKSVAMATKTARDREFAGRGWLRRQLGNEVVLLSLAVLLAAGATAVSVSNALVTSFSARRSCVLVSFGSQTWAGFLALCGLVAIILVLQIGGRRHPEVIVELRFLVGAWVSTGFGYLAVLALINYMLISATGVASVLHLIWSIVGLAMLCVTTAPRRFYTRAAALWNFTPLRSVRADEKRVCKDGRESGSLDTTVVPAGQLLGPPMGRRRSSGRSTSSACSNTVSYGPSIEEEKMARKGHFDVPNPGYSERHGSILVEPGTDIVGERGSPAGEEAKAVSHGVDSWDSEEKVPMDHPNLAYSTSMPAAAAPWPHRNSSEGARSFGARSLHSQSSGNVLLVNPLRVLSDQLGKFFTSTESATGSRRGQSSPQPKSDAFRDVSDEETGIAHAEEDEAYLSRRRTRSTPEVPEAGTPTLGGWAILGPLREVGSQRFFRTRASEMVGARASEMTGSRPSDTEVTPMDPHRFSDVDDHDVAPGSTPLRFRFRIGKRTSANDFARLAGRADPFVTTDELVTIDLEDIFDHAPLLAVLFEIAKKRLCLESVRFVQACRFYRSANFNTVEAQYQAFRAIQRTFLTAGGNDEVNLQHEVVKQIREHGRCLEGFASHNAEERQAVLDSAFFEVKDLLYGNLSDHLSQSVKFAKTLHRLRREHQRRSSAMAATDDSNIEYSRSRGGRTLTGVDETEERTTIASPRGSRASSDAKALPASVAFSEMRPRRSSEPRSVDLSAGLMAGEQGRVFMLD